MRTNYMYARMKRSLATELFALTACLRLKVGAGPGMGTPLSYAVPGQANELVLIEWGTNPMELLVNDKVVNQVYSFFFLWCSSFFPLRLVTFAWGRG